MPKCKLCDLSKKKLAKAHIIPKSLYGWKNASGWDSDGVLASVDRNQRIKRAPVGVYDKEILCHECETRLSRLDDKAAKTFIQEEPQVVLVDGGKPLVLEFQNTGCENLQKFFAFLVWRMAVSSNEMFRHVSLGKYELSFREALKSNEPETVPQLDVFVLRFDRAVNPIMSPTRLRIGGVNGYRIVFPGYSCWVKIDNRPFPEEFREIALSAGGRFRVVSTDFQGSPEHRAAIKILKSRPDLRQLNFGAWKERNA